MDMATQAGLFETLGASRAGSDTLDALLADPKPPRALDILFLWGLNCPNCDIAKAEMRLSPQQFVWPGVRWLQGNVYEDPDLATRYGLHGIPVFLMFRGGRPSGRITSWPGKTRFCAAIERLLAGAR